MQAVSRDSCPACDGDHVSPSSIRGYPIAVCSRCGLRWLVDPPAGGELAALYQTGFYAGPARGGAAVGALHAINNAIRLRILSGIAPGRLLDVGSGKGRFLAAAQDAGWNGLGVEFSEGAAAIARAMFGVNVITGDFLTTPVEGQFDVVTMWHTLEHLPDPRAALVRSAVLLRPDGRLIVSVPNSSSAQARLGGDAWFHLDLPRHLYHFGPRSLSALLERTGFRVERIDYLYPEMEAVGLIQTVLNRAGLGQNVLYRYAKRDQTAGHGALLGASVALGIALIPAGLAWALAAPVLRTGASMQFIARRTASRVIAGPGR